MVVAADDVSDSHRDVVGDDGHVVDRRSVRPQDDEIVEVTPLPRNPPVHRVVPGDLFLRHREPDGVWQPRRFAPRPFCRGQVALGAFVAEWCAQCLRLGAFGVELVAGKEVLVRVAGCEQPLGVCAVTIGTGTLEVRSFVPGDAEP